MQVKKLTLQRLMKEEAALEREPIPNALVTRKGLLNFHFCLHDLEGPYAGGFYHGLLELHENYPFAAPKLIFYTPSGRFDVNLPICTSFTNYHQESWTSAWNVRTLILATISFMYSEEPSYGCRQDSNETRVRYAKSSLEFNFKNKEFMELFGEKMREKGLLPDSKENKRELVREESGGKENYVSYIEQKQESKVSEQQSLNEESQKDKELVPRNKGFRWKPLVKGVLLLGAIAAVVIVVVVKAQ